MHPMCSTNDKKLIGAISCYCLSLGSIDERSSEDQMEGIDLIITQVNGDCVFPSPSPSSSSSLTIVGKDDDLISKQIVEVIADVNLSSSNTLKLKISMIDRLKTDSDRHQTNTACNGIMPVYLPVCFLCVACRDARLAHLLPKLEGKRSDHRRTTVNDMLSIIARRVQTNE